MGKARSLYKAFSSNLEMPKPDGNKKVRLYNRFGMIAFIGIMVPISVIVGYITYVLTDLMYVFGGNSYGLLSELDLISAFAMIFGLPLMFSVLFFSSDLKFLTTLPVRPTTLYSARFWHTFKAENVMTSNVLFAIYIGYFIAGIKHCGVAEALHPIALIASVTGFFGSLLMPLVYSSIIAMLLMLVLRKCKRSSVYYNSSLILFIAFALLFLLSFRSYGKINVSNFISSLVGKENTFTTICNILFPTNYLTTLSVVNHSVFPLIASVVILTAQYLLSLLLAKFTYQRGLFAAAIISDKKSSRKSATSFGTRRIFTSLLIKEIKVLMRTMTYRTNCVYANLLWPVASAIVAVEAGKLEVFKRFRYDLQNGDPKSNVILFIVFIAMAFIASGLNSIASTSFTREGIHIDMLKYLPAPLEKQIYAKLATAILFSFIPESVAVILLTIRLGNPALIPLYIFVSFVCVLTATIIGILMDSVSPYTVWSDELSALRGNLNCFFNLAAEMLAALLIGGICYGLYLLSSSHVIAIATVTVILTGACIVCVLAGLPRVKKNIQSLS